jgi:hypothetical protein
MTKRLQMPVALAATGIFFDGGVVGFAQEDS